MLTFALPLLLSAKAADSPQDKIPAPTLAKLYMALLAIVILGLGMILAVVLGGRMIRKMGRTTETTALHKERWYTKPLAAPDNEDPDSDQHDPLEKD